MSASTTQVFRNLNRRKRKRPFQWSICDGSPTRRSTGNLRGWADSALLINAEFVINDAKLARARRLGKREVFGFVQGHLLHSAEVGREADTRKGRTLARPLYRATAPRPPGAWREVTTNPTRGEFFYRDSSTRVDSSRRYTVWCDSSYRCWIQ